MKQFEIMQKKLQEEIKNINVETSVGGAVKVKMNGYKFITELKIDKEAIDPEDIEMLEDMIMTAINEASKKVDEELQQRTGKLGGGIPGLL